VDGISQPGPYRVHRNPKELWPPEVYSPRPKALPIQVSTGNDEISAIISYVESIVDSRSRYRQQDCRRG
jgi:hypothetical protein